MINNYVIDYSISQKLGLEILKEHDIFPIQEQELFILVASDNPIPNEQILTQYFSLPIKFILTSKQDIQWQIQNFEVHNKIYQLINKSLNNSHKNNMDNSYILNTIDEIILFSINLKTSDIHIEALKNEVVIRFRIDGVLKLIFTFKYEMFALFSTILKLISGLDISQNRLPQNGRFSKVFEGIEYDFRVSTMPIINGESIVLRVLDSQNSKITLDKIGFDNKTFNSIDKIIKAHQGLILVTGPTGSGKTTTLYSILNTLNTDSKKIITVEDPVEYNLAGIQQISINEDIKLTYSKALKNILRQDPDIIMIGEIRDEEALKIAIQASLTGHIVLATLHTNNAPDTINRLLDLNAEPFLIASTLKAIISQRLIRKLCNYCKNKNKPIGCNKCNSSGYIGRINICELLHCDKKIAELIYNKKSINKIVKYAKTKGYITLEENCLAKVEEGITSMDEFYSKIEML